MPRSATVQSITKSSQAYRSIGEAADELGLRPHVLRYWESRFPKFVRPLKRRDGRRMFRPSDLEALKAIQSLVHGRGLTLKEAASWLERQGLSACSETHSPVRTATATDGRPHVDSPARLLQETVRDAFNGESETVQSEPSVSGARGLEATLAGLNDLKARLDLARARNTA